MKKSIRKTYIAIAKEPMSPRNGWLNGVSVGDQLPMSMTKYRTSSNLNHYENVIARKTYFCFVEGDIPVEIPVDVYERTTTVTYKKI